MLGLDNDVASTSDSERATASDASLLKGLVVLARHRRLVLGGMLVTALITAALVLIMPPTYTASAVILASQSPPGSGSALMGELGAIGALASFGGDSILKTQADTFVGVLRSRTAADNLIAKFRLQSLYRNRTLVDARKTLARHTHIEAVKGSLIRISVDDHDARRAAAIANAYVDELYHVNQHLALTSGSQRRVFLEQQVSEESDALGKAEEAFQEIQQKTGVIQLAGQQEMTLRSIAQLRAEISVREVQIQQLRNVATEQNGELQQLESGMESLRNQLKRAETGNPEQEAPSFVSAGHMPHAGLEYLRRWRDLRYHEALYEMLSKQYELARIEEAKAPPVIQVLDRAIVPDKRSWPPRTLLVLLATLISAILLAGLVLLKDKWVALAAEPHNAAHLLALRRVLAERRRAA